MKCYLDPWAAVAGAFLVMVVPLQWLGACAIAAAFHECCHLLMAKWVGAKVESLTIGIPGAKISARFPDARGELLTALAGPMGSFSLVVLLHVAPRIALCAGVQGLYNLLPLYPQDGGRVLACLAEMVAPHRAERICHWVEGITLAGLILLSLEAAVYWRMGLWPLIMALWRSVRWLCQKNSLQIVGNQGTIVLPITKR